jgi:Mg/Co/Ni transporter MgtE
MANQEQMDTLRESLDALIEAGEYARAAELLSSNHPADQADLIEGQEPDVQRALIHAFDPDQLGEILEYLNEELRG